MADTKIPQKGNNAKAGLKPAQTPAEAAAAGVAKLSLQPAGGGHTTKGEDNGRRWGLSERQGSIMIGGPGGGGMAAELYWPYLTRAAEILMNFSKSDSVVKEGVAEEQCLQGDWACEALPSGEGRLVGRGVGESVPSRTVGGVVASRCILLRCGPLVPPRPVDQSLRSADLIRPTQGEGYIGIPASSRRLWFSTDVSVVGG